MRPFITYARVSSDEQKDAETIKTQIAEVEAHARSSETALAAWVTDDGVSGMIPFHERRGGARVLELLRTGDYAGIVCLNHKRVGRDAYVIHLAVRQIEQELRLDIQAVREPVPGQLAPGARALMRAMYAGVAQYDREEDLASMRAGKERAAREGRYVGGTVPFGLKLEALRAPERVIAYEDYRIPAVVPAGLLGRLRTPARRERAARLAQRQAPLPAARPGALRPVRAHARRRLPE